MLEYQWLVSNEVEDLLQHARCCLSARRFRLLQCAHLRRVWSLLTRELFRAAVEVAERYAEGQATPEELAAIHGSVAAALNDLHHLPPRQAMAASVELWLATAAEALTAGTINTYCAPYLERALQAANERRRTKADLLRQQWDAQLGQSHLVRHIVGNPFRPYSAPPSWPGLVVDLGQSLYDGLDNRLILADALEEAGHAELGAHFRQEEWHPKGCWALDLILGKE